MKAKPEESGIRLVLRYRVGKDGKIISKKDAEAALKEADRNGTSITIFGSRSEDGDDDWEVVWSIDVVEKPKKKAAAAA